MVFFVGFNLPGGLLKSQVPLQKRARVVRLFGTPCGVRQLGLLALRMVGRKEDHRVLKGLDDQRC